MITFKDTVLMPDLAAEEYFSMKCYSNSFLKQEVGGVAPEFHASDKVKLGSMVDAILTDVNEVDLTSKFYRPGKEIAQFIASEFGYELWSILQSQLAFTTTMCHAGLEIPFKGRLDKFGLGRVWDLKITHVRIKQIPELIKHLGYFNQQWGYSKGVKADKNAALIFYSVPDRKVHYEFVDISSDSNTFFENAILKFGK